MKAAYQLHMLHKNKEHPFNILTEYEVIGQIFNL